MRNLVLVGPTNNRFLSPVETLLWHFKLLQSLTCTLLATAHYVSELSLMWKVLYMRFSATRCHSRAPASRTKTNRCVGHASPSLRVLTKVLLDISLSFSFFFYGGTAQYCRKEVASLALPLSVSYSNNGGIRLLQNWFLDNMPALQNLQSHDGCDM